MKNYLIAKTTLLKKTVREGVEDFLRKENGDTNFVSIMLIIVIVIALAALFKDNLTKAAKIVFDKLLVFLG